MRITFQRMADRRPVETLIERDDGVVFAMRGSGGGADLPHDLVHAVVETELRIRDGIWGCIADGVVWRSMRHVTGRRPPHAADRSARLKRERAAAVQRAEGVADVVARLAGEERIPHSAVAVLGFPAERLQAAAQALRRAASGWADLEPGDRHVVEWHPAAEVSRGRAAAARNRPAKGRR